MCPMTRSIADARLDVADCHFKARQLCVAMNSSDRARNQLSPAPSTYAPLSAPLSNQPLPGLLLFSIRSPLFPFSSIRPSWRPAFLHLRFGGVFQLAS